jgi:23S rRNA (pseudouridine1915-N3)-methyltransferase
MQEGIELYSKRLLHYIPLEIVNITDIKTTKSLSPEKMKELEGTAILKQLTGNDMAVLLDENGRQMTSVVFADYLQRFMNRGVRNLAFVTGGAYGFSEEVYQKVPERISLSMMTFPHQLIRLIFMEQLYRAFTILKGEAYHHN